MVRSTVFSIVFIFISIISYAQDTALLRGYLLQHRYTIDLKSRHAFDMLPVLMKGKNLFVLGEGGSHELDLYTPLKSGILDQLVKQNLKYFFLELGRSTSSILDKYLHSQTDTCSSAFTNYCDICTHEKFYLQKGTNFKIVGIDFEIRIDFYTNINALFRHADLEKLPVTRAFLANLMDSTVLKMTHKDFMKFYRKKRKEFYENKIAIKQELGDKSNELEYLVTNHNTTRPNLDRNPAMTRNLLHEITPLDTSAVYFLTIGMAHSLPCEHYSLVHKLSRTEQLKNRILVMNLHCDNCSVNGEKLEVKSPMRFLNHQDILNCFRSAANSELVLFDLSQLPPEFSNIKKYGDLLLFAKNQH